MIEETPENTPNTENIFFQKLVDSGFFPQSPEILNGYVINSGNIPKEQEPILEGSETQEQSSVSASELKPEEAQSEEQPGVSSSELKPEQAETQQQSNVSVAELQPTETETQQQSSVSASELKPTETETQQQSSVSASELKPTETETQQQANVSVKELEIVDNQQGTAQSQLSTQLTQPEQTRSLNTTQNNIMDLDRKSKADMSKKEATQEAANPLSSEENKNQQTQSEESSINRSIKDNAPVIADYTKAVIIPKYKQLPSWRLTSG
jgi:hypothetical protein